MTFGFKVVGGDGTEASDAFITSDDIPAAYFLASFTVSHTVAANPQTFTFTNPGFDTVFYMYFHGCESGRVQPTRGGGPIPSASTRPPVISLNASASTITIDYGVGGFTTTPANTVTVIVMGI